MSIMDDVFDVEEFVKDDKGMAEAFERIQTRLWQYEEAYDKAQVKVRIIEDFKALLKEETK